MANKRKSSPPSLGDPGDDLAADRRTPFERAAEEQETTLVDILKREDLNTGVIELKRRAVNETEFGHLGEMAASVFTQENVRKIYGGGDYKVKVRKADGLFAGSFSFKVDYSIPAKFPGAQKPDEDKAADRTPELVTAITAAVKSSLPPPAPAQDNTILLEMIRQQGAAQQAMFSSLLAKPAAPASDPALAVVLGKIVDKLDALGSNRGGGDSFMRELEKFKTLQELIGGGNGGGEDAPAEKPDRISELIRVFGPVLAPLLLKMVSSGGGETAGAPLPMLAEGGVVSNPPPERSAQTPTQPTPADDMNFLFAPFLAEFRRVSILAASKGRNAFEWADAKLDDIDPKWHAKIYELANAEDWFAKIFAADAAASHHVQWLVEMRNAILSRMFVAEVTAHFGGAQKPVAAQFAAAFVEKVSVSFHETLWNLTDPDGWKESFANSGLDAVTLETVRAAFEDELSEDEPSAAPAPHAETDAGDVPKDGAKEACASRPQKPAAARARKKA